MGTTNKMTFRAWLQEMWMKHKDEYAELNQLVPQASVEVYFQQYKYWLKREYRHQMRTDNV